MIANLVGTFWALAAPMTAVDSIIAARQLDRSIIKFALLLISKSRAWEPEKVAVKGILLTARSYAKEGRPLKWRLRSARLSFSCRLVSIFLKFTRTKGRGGWERYKQYNTRIRRATVKRGRVATSVDSEAPAAIKPVAEWTRFFGQRPVNGADLLDELSASMAKAIADHKPRFRK